MAFRQDRVTIMMAETGVFQSRFTRADRVVAMLLSRCCSVPHWPIRGTSAPWLSRRTCDGMLVGLRMLNMAAVWLYESSLLHMCCRIASHVAGVACAAGSVVCEDLS